MAQVPTRILRDDELLEVGDLIYWEGRKKKPTVVHGWKGLPAGSFTCGEMWEDDDGIFRKGDRVERPLRLDVDSLILELERIRKAYHSCEG